MVLALHWLTGTILLSFMQITLRAMSPPPHGFEHCNTLRRDWRHCWLHFQKMNKWIIIKLYKTMTVILSKTMYQSIIFKKTKMLHVPRNKLIKNKSKPCSKVLRTIRPCTVLQRCNFWYFQISFQGRNSHLKLSSRYRR